MNDKIIELLDELYILTYKAGCESISTKDGAEVIRGVIDFLDEYACALDFEASDEPTGLNATFLEARRLLRNVETEMENYGGKND